MRETLEEAERWERDAESMSLYSSNAKSIFGWGQSKSTEGSSTGNDPSSTLNAKLTGTMDEDAEIDEVGKEETAFEQDIQRALALSDLDDNESVLSEELTDALDPEALLEQRQL